MQMAVPNRLAAGLLWSDELDAYDVVVDIYRVGRWIIVDSVLDR